MAKSVEGIQINEDRAHQRREWAIERAGWGVMALLLLAGLLGLLGNGPLGRAQAGTPGTLTVDYDRLQRAKAPTAYRFDIAPSVARDGAVRVRLADTLLEEAQIDAIIPEPASVRAGPGFTEFEFAMAPGGDRSRRVVIEYHPTTFGAVRGEIRVAGAEPLQVDHFVFP